MVFMDHCDGRRQIQKKGIIITERVPMVIGGRVIPREIWTSKEKLLNVGVIQLVRDMTTEGSDLQRLIVFY